MQPLHVASWIELQTREMSAPTVKLRLAAIRHLFDWLVTGHVVPLNPAASVRGPSHSVRKGKTPVLNPAEARALLDSIDISTPIGQRDRAQIALMVLQLRADRGGARHAGRGRLHPEPASLGATARERRQSARGACHHTLEVYLHA